VFAAGVAPPKTPLGRPKLRGDIIAFHWTYLSSIALFGQQFARAARRPRGGGGHLQMRTRETVLACAGEGGAGAI